MLGKKQKNTKSNTKDQPQQQLYRGQTPCQYMGSDPCTVAAAAAPQTVDADLAANKKLIEQMLGDSSDIKIREFEFGKTGRRRALVLFVDGLADADIVNHQIIEPIMYSDKIAGRFAKEKTGSLQGILETLITIGEVKEVETVEEAVEGVLTGDTALFIDGEVKCFVLGSKGFSMRSVEQPDSEVVVRGPKESFNENIRTNTSLLRRKIKNPMLRMESMTIGERTKTPIEIVYIENLVKPGLVDEIKKRLNKIDTDCILDSGYIEQYIEDAPYSIFPTIGHTEKPDVLAAKILEGRAGIIVDGSPVAITMPYLFIENFQSAEDYYIRPWFSSLLRAYRFLAFALCIFVPAFYVALTTFHQGIIPTKLLYTMAAARQGVPFSAFFESIVMLVMFELLREAGLRMPKPVGQTIMGDAAVSAGLVSAPLLICIALSAVAGFVVSGLNSVQSLLRLFYLVAAALLGGLGIMACLFVTMVHMSSLQSFGQGYFQPIAPLVTSDMKDTFVRVPLWKMILRPTGFSKNKVRFRSGGANIDGKQ